MRVRPVLLVASAFVLVVVVVGAWMLLRPVDPAGTAVPATITVPERSPGTVAPVPSDPAPKTTPTDVVPPPPLDDDDDDDDDGPDDRPDDGPDSDLDD